MSIVEGEERAVNVNEVPDYAAEIHTHLRAMEVCVHGRMSWIQEFCLCLIKFSIVVQVKCRPKAGYMRKQPDITNSMRAILVDWLVEVGEEYKLQNETLHLAVNYIDRFLSSMSVLRGKLQLVGTAAMLLASWVCFRSTLFWFVLLRFIYRDISLQEVWRDLPPWGGRVCLHYWRHLHKETSVKNGASGTEGPLFWSGSTHDCPVSHPVLPQAASVQQSGELVHGELGFNCYWIQVSDLFIFENFPTCSKACLPVSVSWRAKFSGCRPLPEVSSISDCCCRLYFGKLHHHGGFMGKLYSSA